MRFVKLSKARILCAIVQGSEQGFCVKAVREPGVLYLSMMTSTLLLVLGMIVSSIHSSGGAESSY
jgi:hypothetical protein